MGDSGGSASPAEKAGSLLSFWWGGERGSDGGGKDNQVTDRSRQSGEGRLGRPPPSSITSGFTCSSVMASVLPSFGRGGSSQAGLQAAHFALILRHKNTFSSRRLQVKVHMFKL